MHFYHLLNDVRILHYFQQATSLRMISPWQIVQGCCAQIFFPPLPSENVSGFFAQPYQVAWPQQRKKIRHEKQKMEPESLSLSQPPVKQLPCFSAIHPYRVKINSIQTVALERENNYVVKFLCFSPL